MPDGSFRLQRICDVPISHLTAIWPRVRHYIEDALAIDKCGRYRASDIFQVLLAGRARLWTAFDRASGEFDAAMVTEIIQYPRCRECRVWLVGGRHMKRWAAEFRDMVESYARAEECSHMASSGRRGAVRVAGYRQVGYDLIKRLA